MRPTLLAAALAAFAIGCTSTTSSKIQPAPRVSHDEKTPVAPSKPSLLQRLKAQRIQDAQVAQGRISVEGPVIK